MTVEELQAIKDRCVAATSGPWFSRTNRDFGAYPNVVADRFALICSLSNGTKSPEECNADCDCIAHARTDIPALLAHIEHLQRLYTFPCPYCDFGSGQRGMDRCPHCDGTGRMDVHVFVAQQRDAARTEVEGVRAELAKATADKAALVEELNEIKADIEDCDECRCDEVFAIARAVLARVKGEA